MLKNWFNKISKKVSLQSETAIESKNDPDGFEPMIRDLFQEAKEHNRSFYGSLKLTNCATYDKIKSSSDEFKIKLILSLPEVIIEEVKSTRGGDNWKKLEERRHINGLRIHILGALLRTKIAFSEDHLIRLMVLFKKNTTNYFTFTQWPIGLAITQIEKHIKANGLSESLRTYLEDVLKWSHFDSQRSYWGSDVQKAKTKLETILFENSDSKLVAPPYHLNEQDKFGPFVNQKVGAMDEKEAQYWYQFFYHALTATGGKPTKKYLTTSKAIVTDIGNHKFKLFATECVNFVAQLKPEETTHTHRYNDGREYTYSSWTFLEEKNAVILKGMVWSLVQFHDSKTLSLLGDLTDRAFKKIPGVGPAAASVGNAAIYVLAHSKGLTGVSQLSRLKLKVTQNNTKKLIQKYLDEASSKLGITAEEIEEISIPDFGLSDGKKEIEFDDYKLVVEITGVGKTTLTWLKPDRKEQKSVPAFVKQSAKLKQRLTKAKSEAKNIQKYTTAQRDRIDRSFILDRVWDYEHFEKYYLNHGLVSFIARKLIWVIKNGAEPQSAIFIDGRWQNISGEEVPISKETKVSLWHPIFDSTETVLQWRNRLEELRWQQPVKQAYREIYLLTDAEVNTKSYSNRMAAHLLKQHQFNSLAGIRNWKYQLMGAYDDGRDNEIATLSLPTWGLKAEYWINEVYMDGSFNDAGIWDYVATDQVKFVDDDGRTKDLIEVPKIVLSEVMRDADLFVGVASVGNDPAWQDSGGERVRQYGDYWQQYSFGDLNEMAKTRKQVLEKIVPRLKIKNVAKIDGKFLRIKGKVREYKIHIGSTNILMEPNNQYLCIVPASGSKAETKNVFLPFEGDRGLSLIISKAFLLADDDKIEDPTILSQLKR
ncbi:DUF4132 domain-containing protein [Fulvivirga sp. 29W222]|uniref:DUF4132 domain-containing protein n=1 Tax=Fulvivirga marina TaxID=2494733 RepID=A0A937FYC9_9BACT|nr:DUF4132 domain-containing protein [Fulvivirga marina]MBL6447057.1 DUF4132 domain-containing protein [Fulvivirga marina]